MSSSDTSIQDFDQHVYFGMPAEYVRGMFALLDSRLTSNNPEGFPMIPTYFFNFSLRYRFAGRSLASQGPDMFQDVASASCAALTTVSVDGYGYG